MDDSDDYFQDTFELDDNDLALLAAEEAKYIESISQIPTRVVDTRPPPPKRQKTLHRQLSESEDILDVFIQPDGTYGVAAVMHQAEEDGKSLASDRLLATESQKDTLPAQVNSAARSKPIQDTQPQTTLQASNSNEPTPHRQTARSTTPKPSNRPSRPANQYARPIAGPSVIIAGSENTDRGVPSAKTVNSDSKYQEELAALKATVEMLKLENDKSKEALREAEVARFAKEGEVTILRKRAEKAAQQHAEDLVKIRTTKEAAEKEQLRIQKEMKEQVERLRTEYIFKQHEVESSVRKQSWSTRSKRMALQSQQSPVPLPPAMRNWSSANAAGPNRNNLVFDTPSRRGSGPDLVEKLGPPRTTTKSVPELKFPGFENSFLPSSPVNSPSRSRHTSGNRNGSGSVARTPQKINGKNAPLVRGKNVVLSPVKIPTLTLKLAGASSGFDELPMDDSIQDFEGDVEMNDGSPRRKSKTIKVGSSPFNGQDDMASIVDFDLSDGPNREMQPEEIFEGIDWSDELHYLLFSHEWKASKLLTFHFLLSASIPERTDYQQACSAILETLGTKYKYATAHELMEAVANNLLSMLAILWEARYTRHLRALFDLLNVTMAYIPAFTSAVLQSGLDKEDAPHKLLHVFCDISITSLAISESKNEEERQSSHSLVHAMLAFLKTITWTVPDLLCTSLRPLVQTDKVLLTLLDGKQSSSIITETIRVLVLLASHPSLFVPILSTANIEKVSRIPLIERLCGFLADPKPLPATSVEEDLSSVLNIFALLSTASSEGRPALLRSNTLIPCLVEYLTRLTTLLWEDDVRVMQAPEVAKITVRNIKQALHLLHRLVVPSPIVEDHDDDDDVDFDFRHKLFYAPHALFNGLAHMFVVMIGRLSYADPPDWLDSGLQAEIEKLTEPARDLMDLIVEGPEGDSVWVAYQDGESDSVTENDDEMEARLLDDNEFD